MKKLLLSFMYAAVLLMILLTGCKNSKLYLNLNGYKAPESIKMNTDFNIEGTIECNETIKCAGIKIKDVNTNRYEISKTLSNNENVFDLDRFNEYIDFGRLSEGEKSIEVVALRNNAQEILRKDTFFVKK